MSVKKVTQIGAEVLRSISSEVELPIADGTREIIRDLIDTMRDANLIGIAAPQIGIGERIFVTEIRGTKYRDNESIHPELKVYINPEIVSLSNSLEGGIEGCGSLCKAGLFGEVERSVSVVIAAYDEQGKKFTLEANGLLGRCIQHEMDHINGVMCIDKFKDTRTLMSVEHYQKTKK